MFSFFKTKKPSPSSSPETDPIPSAGSDFVIVDPKQGTADPKPLYPYFDGNFGHPSMIPPVPTRPPLQHMDSVHQTNYINGVPFKLSSELSTGDSSEMMKIQVDDILAQITSRLEIRRLDYDFTLERSLIQQGDTTDSAEPADEPDAAE